MKRLVCLAALALLLSGTGQARAGNLTLDLTWSAGTTGPIDFTSPFALPGSTADLLMIDVQALNKFLAGNDSNFSFFSLTASSNNPGDPASASLSETASASLSGTLGDSSITVSASQSEFTSPFGTGTLSGSAGASFTNVPFGDSLILLSSMDGTDAPPVALISAGGAGNLQTGSKSLDGVTGAETGYTLDASATINFSDAFSGASAGFAAATTFAPTAAPEPASLTLLGLGVASVAGYGWRRRR
jgi:hypothetical protein